MSKVIPTPWTVKEAWSTIAGKIWEIQSPEGLIAKFLNQDDADQCALAINAEAVMMKRGWAVLRRYSEEYTDGPPQFYAAMPHVQGSFVHVMHGSGQPYIYWPHPFIALVEGDKWWKENPGTTVSTPGSDTRNTPTN